MRPQKVDDNELLDKMIPLFRNNGFEGTSMQDLSLATGLKKASLYHRFPGGKEEMVLAVLDYASIKVKDTILHQLTNIHLSIEERINAALEGIKSFYDQGTAPCFFRTLSMGNWLRVFIKRLEVGMVRWIDAFKQLGLDAGLPEEDAQKRATQAIIMIQGSLVVSQTMDTTAPFISTLDDIKALYL